MLKEYLEKTAWGVSPEYIEYLKSETPEQREKRLKKLEADWFKIFGVRKKFKRTGPEPGKEKIFLAAIEGLR